MLVIKKLHRLVVLYTFTYVFQPFHLGSKRKDTEPINDDPMDDVPTDIAEMPIEVREQIQDAMQPVSQATASKTKTKSKSKSKSKSKGNKKKKESSLDMRVKLGRKWCATIPNPRNLIFENDLRVKSTKIRCAVWQLEIGKNGGKIYICIIY